MTQIELLTPKETAALLKVPISWIYERTRKRTIPVIKLGRHVRIPMDELLVWINQKETTKAA